MARNAFHSSLDTSFNTSIEGIKSVWGPLSSEVVAACRGHLEDLLKAPPTEKWLEALHSEAPTNKELYRDPTTASCCLAHTEHAGLYRPPHDHGRAGSSMPSSKGKSRWAPTPGWRSRTAAFAW